MKLLKIDLLYLSMLSFVFVASFSLSLSRQSSIVVEKGVKAKSDAIVYPRRPVASNSVSTIPSLTSQAAYAVDVNSGVTLYDKNANSALLPASTTKIVTALVSLDAYDLNQVLNVHAVSVDGQKMGLVLGEEITVRSLLYGLLVYSANDAAEVLAQNYCEEGNCGREVFVTAMNRKVAALGLENTHFTNPAGLDASGHYSTARDLARVAGEAMKNLLFAKIVGTKEIEVSDTSGNLTYKLDNINELLGEVPGVLGVKTGWTQNARENLVTYVERDDNPVILVVLGSQDRFGETKKLIDWVYGSYEWEEVVYNN